MKDPYDAVTHARQVFEEVSEVGTPLTKAWHGEFLSLLVAAEELAKQCTLLRDIAAGQEARPATAPATRMPGEEGRRREVAACTLSLAAAIQAAGGNVAMRDLSLLNLTLGEFICEIAAQNGIRFQYMGPRAGGA